MNYPRIKEFDFDIEKTFKVPSHLVGRLSRIAFQLFGDFKYYKPLAAANDIKLSSGFRVGLRPIEKALDTELKEDGFTEREREELIFNKMGDKRINDLDWYNYFDVSYGYMSEVSEGRLLLVPSFSSATQYLNQFEFIKGS